MKIIKALRLITGLIGLVLAAVSCQAGAPSSPLSVSAAVSPSPLVDQVVTWRIEVQARGRDMPQTKLELSLPPSVELVAGQSEYLLDVAKDEPSVVEVAIRVTTAGEWPIDAYATWPADPKSVGFFGGSKRLYLVSDSTSAKVIEDIYYPTQDIPTLQLPPDFLTPVMTTTP
ncbi:MAG: hypothetical protein ROW48_04990 [Bellilinea sp.]|jgi:hypothetical protein